jgi:hypothetical protein
MVTKNDALSRFEIEEDGQTAFLEFQQDGGRLAKGALPYAREHGMRVKATCEFVRSYLERHPEERDMVDDS